MQSINDGDFNGIDILNLQGNVDFEAVKKSGIKIVYIKATEGNYFRDPYLNTNYEKAKKSI